MRALLIPLLPLALGALGALGVLAGPGNLGARPEPTPPESLEVTGYAGVLGEWELTPMVVTAIKPAGSGEYVGPLKMKHVGWCTQGGPEEKTGELRLQVSGLSSRLTARLTVDGIECTYRARLSDSYTGTMDCPGRGPVPLELWLK